MKWHEIGQVENARKRGWTRAVSWPLDLEEDRYQGDAEEDARKHTASSYRPSTYIFGTALTDAASPPSQAGPDASLSLSRGVGQAILNYILDVRPPLPERTLFFTLRAPFRPLGRSSLGNLVHRRLNRLGIASVRRGPHALRHAAAQHLLDQGMSMKVIGDFLGHRDPSSTAVYAKVNLNALREVADFDLEGLA